MEGHQLCMIHPGSGLSGHQENLGIKDNELLVPWDLAEVNKYKI